jgi:two-component system sensor histidine kinase SenX3
VITDGYGNVVHASAHAYRSGLVRGNKVANTELAEVMDAVRHDQAIRDVELTLKRSPRRSAFIVARIAPLRDDLVLALVEDRTRERRVEAIRRDFVVNVSHELKTPVGALNLLAEAIQEAADDPQAVNRFAARMQTESARLTHLVQQIIELSRLQGDDPLDEPAPVEVDAVIARSIDHCAIEAKTKDIEVVQHGDTGLTLAGNTEQVALALGNLVSNAVNYSPEHTTVVVSAKANDEWVDLSVTDQGIGIPEAEIERIFERFYRVDPARHRSTGGTGLGLSIVKHIAASHGGEVKVWSREGQGSTFTMTLPRRTPEEEIQ